MYFRIFIIFTAFQRFLIWKFQIGMSSFILAIYILMTIGISPMSINNFEMSASERRESHDVAIYGPNEWSFWTRYSTSSSFEKVAPRDVFPSWVFVRFAIFLLKYIFWNFAYFYQTQKCIGGCTLYDTGRACVVSQCKTLKCINPPETIKVR